MSHRLNTTKKPREKHHRGRWMHVCVENVSVPGVKIAGRYVRNSIIMQTPGFEMLR